MEETPDQENARLLGPLIAERNAAAHEVLRTLLEGRHDVASRLLPAYQVAAMAVEGAEQICSWFDASTYNQNSDDITPDQASE